MSDTEKAEKSFILIIKNNKIKIRCQKSFAKFA